MNRKALFPLAALIVSLLACNNRLLDTATAESQSQPAIFTATPAAQLVEGFLFSQQIKNYISREIDDAIYCTVDGVPLRADIYFPKNAQTALPLLIYIHGGAWYGGSKTDGTFFQDAPALLNAGFTVASIDYRLAPEYKMPAMIEDVKCAVRFFRARAAWYNIDPGRIGVWGTSAGGHLASMLGVADESAGFDVGEYLEYSSRVQAVVDMFGPADLTGAFMKKREQNEIYQTVFGFTDLSNPAFTKSSPTTYVSYDDPPFLILQGDADTVVPLNQSQGLYDRLIAAGVDAQLVVVKGGGHGLGRPGELPPRGELTEMMVNFFIGKLMYTRVP
jgi:acetyl esterase/lipase